MCKELNESVHMTTHVDTYVQQHTLIALKLKICCIVRARDKLICTNVECVSPCRNLGPTTVYV
jgi:hypothetical protein